MKKVFGMKKAKYDLKKEKFVEIFIYWLVILPFLFWALKSEFNEHIYGPIFFTILCFVLVIWFPISDYRDYNNNVLKKPVKIIKAKLVKKSSQLTHRHCYFGIFRLPSGIEVRLTMSPIQHEYLNNGDDIILMCQGWLVHSVKKDTDKIPVFNGEYLSGKKFADYAFKFPMQSSKARVTYKSYGNSVTLLLEDKSKAVMTVSKKQYKRLKKGMAIGIIYQGWIIHCIKTAADENLIYNEDFSSEDIIKKHKHN